MTRRFTLLLPLLLLLAACGAGDPGFVRLGDYEGDAGEAMVRHLVKTVPDLAPGVPKEYCVMKARQMQSTDTTFVARFQDLKLIFISGDTLTTYPGTTLPINPKSGISPYVLQLAYMHKQAADTWEMEAGWAYKLTFERRRYRLKQTGGAWKVEDLGKLDGNYDPAVKH